MNEIVIVAIPAEDDPVWKVSSEKVPHLTLCFLKGPFENEENTILFVEHVVSTSLSRFGLSVDRRGTLGADDADVLFFDKSYGGKELLAFRAFLLANKDIYQAYKKAEQYPIWTPHLTLGYPETPANEMPEHGIHWINFDRVAVWTSDFDGPEFVLDRNDDFADGAAWSFKDSSAFFAHKFKESSVKRDGKGQFTSFFGVAEDEVIGEDTITIDGVTTTTITTRDSSGNITESVTTTDAAGRKTYNTTVNGEKVKPLIDFSKVEKTLKKINEQHQPGAFNEKVKLNPSQVESESSASKAQIRRKQAKIIIREITNRTFNRGAHGSEEKRNKKIHDILNPKGAKRRGAVHSELLPGDSLDDVLMHFGVRGMKWGVRNSKYYTKSTIVTNKIPLLGSQTLDTSGKPAVIASVKKASKDSVANVESKLKRKLRNSEDVYDIETQNAGQQAEARRSNRNVNLIRFGVAGAAFAARNILYQSYDDGVVIGYDESLGEDFFEHFGVRGMRWGVRRSLGSGGLVEGTVAGAIKSGQRPKARSGSNPITKAKKGKSQGSADHQRMVKNLNKKVENLSTKDIKELSSRIKAVNDLKTTTDSQKAAKAHISKRITKWALVQVKEGARKQGETWIQDQTGGVLKGLLPDFRPKSTGTQPNPSSKLFTKVTPKPGFKSTPTDKTPEREAAVKELAAEITALKKEE